MENAAKNITREKVLVPHFEMIEAELPTPAEKEELLASLREGEEQFARGEFKILKKGDLLKQYHA